MKKFNFVITSIMLSLFFSSVLPAAQLEPINEPSTKKSGPVSDPTKAWQPKWDKTLQAAKAEGKVVIYTTAGSDVRSAFSRGMKEKYALNLEFVTARAPEMVKKVLNERRAGLYIGDVYLSGGTSTLRFLVPEGVIDVITPEFILPEVKDISKWYGNKFPFIDKEQRLFGFRGSVFQAFTINTTQVKPGELVSYNDILKPAFKGKIAMGDPTITGAANTFVTVVATYFMGPDYIKQLVKQGPFFSRDERLLTEWVARGKYSVLIGTKPDPIAEFLRAGAPLLPIIPKEGSMIDPGSGTVSVMNKRPHPNATRIFINWLLSKDGQTAYTESAGIESAREDVSKAHLAAGLVRETGKKYIFGDEEFRTNSEKALQRFMEDFKAIQK